jgi:hypothetical protein
MAEERKPSRVYANCRCGHAFGAHTLEGCLDEGCACTVYYANYPRCGCVHFARSHVSIRPGVYGECAVCRCEVYRPVGFKEAGVVEIEYDSTSAA